MLNWIKFTNNYHTVDFLTLISGYITGQSNPDRPTDLCQNSLIIKHVAFQKYISILEKVVVLKQPRSIVVVSTKWFT